MIGPIRKALVAGVLAGAGMLLAANGTFTDGGSNITSAEWWSALGALAVTGFTTWLTPNDPNSRV
jgi:hypothetical protein